MKRILQRKNSGTGLPTRDFYAPGSGDPGYFYFQLA